MKFGLFDCGWDGKHNDISSFEDIPNILPVQKKCFLVMNSILQFDIYSIRQCWPAEDQNRPDVGGLLGLALVAVLIVGNNAHGK